MGAGAALSAAAPPPPEAATDPPPLPPPSSSEVPEPPARTAMSTSGSTIRLVASAGPPSRDHHGCNGRGRFGLGKPFSTRSSRNSQYSPVGSGESARSRSPSSWSSRSSGSGWAARPVSRASSIAVSTSLMAGLSQLRDGAVQARAHVRLRHPEHAGDLAVRQPTRELQRDQVALLAVERAQGRPDSLPAERQLGVVL